MSTEINNINYDYELSVLKNLLKITPFKYFDRIFSQFEKKVDKKIFPDFIFFLKDNKIYVYYNIKTEVLYYTHYMVTIRHKISIDLWYFRFIIRELIREHFNLKSELILKANSNFTLTMEKILKLEREHSTNSLRFQCKIYLLKLKFYLKRYKFIRKLMYNL